MNLIKKTSISSLLTLFAISVSAHDTSRKNIHQVTLKQVMQGLLKDSQKISEGIFLQKFEQIQLAATSIANHPAPAIEIRQKLAKTLGSEMGVFKR